MALIRLLRQVACSLCTLVVPFLLPIAIITSSFVLYQLSRSSYLPLPWQGFRFDGADFRFIAEHFWGVPSDPATYDWVFGPAWRVLLTRIPFREIGAGTVYLAVRAVTVFFDPSAADDTIRVGMITVWTLQGVLACASLILFTALRRRFGLFLGLLGLLLTVFPPYTWALTENFFAEPVIRILFLLLAACIAAGTQRPARPLFGFLAMGLLILVSGLRSQWLPLAAFLLVGFLLLWRKDTRRLTQVALCIAALLVPLSVATTNAIGWGTWSLSPGIGLHLSHKTVGASVNDFCRSTDHARSSSLCTSNKRVWWWSLPLSTNTTQGELLSLDRHVPLYLLRHPRSTLRNLWDGFLYATNFPNGIFGDQPYIPPPFGIRIIDIATWFLLIAGLFSSGTVLFSLTGLAFWIIPALGNVLSVYTTRYHQSMEGLPLLLALLVALMLSGLLRKMDDRADAAGNL